MTFVNHGLLGANLALLGPARRHGRAALLVLVASAMLPDADALLMLVRRDFYVLYHRTITHSLPGITLLAVLVALVARALSGKRAPGGDCGGTAAAAAAPPVAPSFVALCLYALAGLASHVATDIIDRWPIPLLYPFSTRGVCFSIVGWGDPIMLALLLVAPFVAASRPERGRAAAAVALAAFAAYLGFRAVRPGGDFDLVTDLIDGPLQRLLGV